MVRAKKSLGQNFLNSKKITRDIVSVSSVTDMDTLLEIGPGRGALTEALLETGARVFAVETDADLIPVLTEKFAHALKSKQLTLIHDDVRNYYTQTHIFGKEFKLVANIPYYITGEIIRGFLSNTHQPSSMTILVQKEVAQRITCAEKESLLSLSVKAYGVPRIALKVPARFFKPIPKVDSAVLHITHISKDFFKDITEDDFFTLIKAGFAQKRKKLINNLSSCVPKARVQELFAELHIDENTRAETLSITTWGVITKKLAPYIQRENISL